MVTDNHQLVAVPLRQGAQILRILFKDKTSFWKKIDIILDLILDKDKHNFEKKFIIIKKGEHH